MKYDLGLGLILSLAVALAIGGPSIRWERLQPAAAQAPVLDGGGQSLATPPISRPATEPVIRPTGSEPSLAVPGPHLSMALTDVFPKDYRSEAAGSSGLVKLPGRGDLELPLPPEPATSPVPPAQEPELTDGKPRGVAIPIAVAPSRLEETESRGTRSVPLDSAPASLTLPPTPLADPTPIVPDAPGSAQPAGPQSRSRAGPVHPYFERFLERGEYYVRPGDTLENIAHRLYSDPAKAQDILRSNPGLPSAGQDLAPGTMLRLP